MFKPVGQLGAPVRRRRLPIDRLRKVAKQTDTTSKTSR